MLSKNRKRILASMLIVGSFFTTLLVGCGKEKEVETKPEAKGFQWEVKKDDKKMYLIGTMHPINTDYEYFSSNVNKIMEETDVLGVEVDLTQEEVLKANADGVYTGSATIEDELNDKQIENLKSICKESGIEYDKLKVLKPHMIVNNLQAVLYNRAELSMDTFDNMLIEKTKNDKKKVVQLESMEFQMKLLDKVNGINSLKQLLDEHKDGKFIESGKEVIDYSKGLMEGYAKGDAKVMEDAIKLQKENPESYKPMIKDRNDEMVKKIEGYFKEDETYTIAVGALHFFGDDGIVKLMENKGYTVTRME
ncbi:MAG: TraB/GumN family protein [Clostridium baratii]|uniref:TraB family protein n=1 Tax=Clostridium baratii str. Sullivan TaxID=1415775 RepID=A0A0A7FVZ1_9CLOT|nr:TraB/GumN family protein [Clostridium baratii]AIY83767.1 traB family protein [Clostridium baratii str. Sullivan]MBS6007793.1 TraB/GumN family protein [Clostridium baratii]CUP72672.1 GumN family protein [Clostridium baratii]